MRIAQCGGGEDRKAWVDVRLYDRMNQESGGSRACQGCFQRSNWNDWLDDGG